ncbi:MAG: hypothetical protein IKZ07_05850 [Akkermansia sp.]|nr:hypothetical protein [Akkermansia sp.]
MYKEEMYNGERVAVAPVAQPVVPRDVMSDAVAEGMRHVAAQVGQLVRTGAQMEDAKNEFESERALMALQDSTRKEMERRLHLPDGHEEAFFDKAGNIRETQMADMKARVDKALGGIGVNIIDPERRQQMQQKAGLTGARLLDSIGQTWESVQREKMEGSWRDALELAEERGQQGEVFSLIDRGVQMGIIPRSRGELLKVRMENKRLRGLGAAARAGVPQVVTLGGKEYSGANAALAMVASAGEAKGEAKAEVPDTAPMQQAAVVAPEEVVAPQLVSAWDGVLPEPNSLDAYTMLPESERIALVDDFTFDRKVLTMTDDMGKEHFSCPVTAPETVQRVAAQAEAKGELDVDTCRGMVARITMDSAVENPEVSTEQILKQFDDSGIYAALGNGDAEVGKARTRAIVEEMRQRAQAGTTKVNMPTIQRMVDAKVHEPTFGSGQEWKSMEALDPMLKKKSDGTYPEWEKGSDDVQRKKWFDLLGVYRKYRTEFNPYAEALDPEDDDAERDEFNENAGAFYAWYKENVYPQQKKAAQDAAQDYYTAAVVEELRGRVDVNQSGQAVYTGYANEVALTRDVLSKPLPSDLGVAALAQREKAIQQGDVDLSKSFRETAAGDYKKLGKMKQAEAENSAAAKKAKERQEAAEKREAEKSAKEAEKRAEQQEARRLFVARSQPRQANWAWDGENAPDGEQPLCTVPVEEYHRLQQELGYDGTQLVYLRVGSSKVLVVGTNSTGKIQLNTPAVLKIQAKPNSKKGEKYRVNGELGYSYQFTNAK